MSENEKLILCPFCGASLTDIGGKMVSLRIAMDDMFSEQVYAFGDETRALSARANRNF